MAKIQTRARAVDMLGRQQIAGVQNALAELFKNAFDAYADRIAVDHFEDFGANGEGFLLIRDDGFGMTEEDFIGKWLVLGTESKARLEPPYIPEGKARRPVMGEKGIGRLAIALLGEQMLVLTRARRAEGVHDLVVGLVHWGLFEIPGINLDQIDVPVSTVSDGGLPSPELLAGMRNQLTECVDRLNAGRPELDLSRIKAQIDSFAPDVSSVYRFLKSAETDEVHLTLEDGGIGTHFLIAPSNPVIRMEMQTELRESDYGFRKQLLGFADTVFASEPGIPFSTSLRRWGPGDVVGTELLDPATFFNRDELVNDSDHYLSGTVDEFGQFSGTLRVYGDTYQPLEIPWSGASGRETRCGPFALSFGYLMGRNSESRLPPEKWAPLNEKLDHVGGIYIYREGIRILPYGDGSFDWLEVEKRRSKSAGYYFFSYRRMFGAVQLKRGLNDELKEKAGREGFQQNEAYRQFRDILMNLLVQLAAEFFRSTAPNAATFEKVQAELKKQSQALERQRKRSQARRQTFIQGLQTFSADLDAGLPDSEVANLLKVARSRMDAAARLQDQDKAAAALVRAEQDAMSSLAALRGKYTRKRPTGVALGRELQRDWEGYLAARDRLETEVFAPFEQEVSNTLGAVAAQARVYIDQRKRLEERLKLLAAERKKELAEASRQANATATETRQTVFTIAERARLALDETVRSIEADLHRTDLATMAPDRIESLRRQWEEHLTEVEGRHRDSLMAARDMLASLAENLLSSGGEEPAQIMQALEERVMALEEQADEDFEMVQLGLAVAIINHEFAASISSVRKSVQQLGQLSRRADGLRPLYESIRTNFEHLDGHLNLFTPLQRRLHRSRVRIEGADIRNYCTALFANRLERHRVEFRATDRLLKTVVECYPSTLYPAIINIVDNAIYWLSQVKGARFIELDADEDTIYISNNGPAIEARDAERIFERSFSRKVGGRGLGLFISSQALKAEGMNLSIVDAPRSGANVTFAITLDTRGANP
ncbi:MAG: ATP-binding protein [Rhizobiaceae bacterium]|nr:ATP-binding protein [Rhizobiaceae bacterium]